MVKRRPNHRMVKIHRNYTVEETARLCGIHKNTVRIWLKMGLPVIDDRRPMLILGRDLAVFLRLRRNGNKKVCQPGEIYCVGCRVSKRPAGNMVDYIPRTEKLGTLKGICPSCDCVINRLVSIVQLTLVCGNLDITFQQAPRQVSNTNQLDVNSYLEWGEER